DRRAGDLSPEARGNVCDLVVLGVEARGQVLPEPVLVRLRQRLHPHLEVLVLVAPEGLTATLDDRVGLADVLCLVADRRERDRLLRLEGHLRAALRVDPAVSVLCAGRGRAAYVDIARG